jgi:hypothetical protein
LEGSPVVIRYAENDNDVIAIHQFLLVVARPAMLCPVNPIKSLNEIIRVTKEEVALMAIKDGHLVGTLGLIRPVWWYGDEAFLTDRWHFVLPQFHHGEPDKALKAEARKIADDTGLKFIDQGKIRPQKDGTSLLMPRIYSSESATLQPQGDTDVLRPNPN